MQNRTLLPVWIAFASALLWGIWWMPVRALENTGLIGPFAGVALIAGALPLTVLLFLTDRGRHGISLRAIASGALIGSAMMLYSAAITETTIVRAILLFYLAPAWAILIEVLFMGRRLHPLNGVAFLLAGTGILLIFRGDISLENWGFGDAIAVASGISWALGSALVFTGQDVGARRLALFGCSGGVFIGIGLALGTSTPVPDSATLTAALPVSLVSGTLYLAPVLVATLWSARRLTPTTLSFLLTAEIVSGIATAAWFLSEPFGLPETAGTTLIIAAGMTEALRRQPKT